MDTKHNVINGLHYNIITLPDTVSYDKSRILHELSSFIKRVGEEIKCKACRAFYLFFATSLINSIKQEHEC